MCTYVCWIGVHKNFAGEVDRLIVCDLVSSMSITSVQLDCLQRRGLTHLAYGLTTEQKIVVVAWRQNLKYPALWRTFYGTWSRVCVVSRRFAVVTMSLSDGARPIRKLLWIFPTAYLSLCGIFGTSPACLRHVKSISLASPVTGHERLQSKMTFSLSISRRHTFP